MVKKRKKGPLSKAIHHLCSSTLLEPVNKSAFKDGLRKIIDEFKLNIGSLVFQDTGLAIRKWILNYAPNREEEIWQLIDEVEPEIKQRFERLAN